MGLRVLLLLVAVSVASASSQPDRTKSVRAAIEEQYAQQKRAYIEQNPELIRAVRAPDFSAQPPSGPRSTPAEADAYLTASFEQVKRTLRLSFDIQSLTVQGDTATAIIHQQWKREQNRRGSLRVVETEAVQREWWRRTADGWRIFFIDDIHPGVWKVDGKRIDPAKPYDPDAPPYDPDDKTKAPR